MSSILFQVIRCDVRCRKSCNTETCLFKRDIREEVLAAMNAVLLDNPISIIIRRIEHWSSSIRHTVWDFNVHLQSLIFHNDIIALGTVLRSLCPVVMFATHQPEVVIAGIAVVDG